MIPELLPTQADAAVPLERTCPPDSSWVCESVYDAVGGRWAAWAEWFVSVPLTVLLVIAVAFVVNRIARYLIKRSLNRLLQPPSEGVRRASRVLRRAAPAALLRTSPLNLRIDARVQTLTTVFRSIATVLIWFVAGVTVLQVIGFNITSLITIGGVAGVAVGFGAQHVVRDFLAGMFIVLEDQFGVGDIVDIGNDAKGEVEEVTLRTTRVRDVNGTLWHVPNGEIKRVANKTQEWARAVLDVEVDGATDYEVAGPLIQEVATAMAAEEQWMADIVASPEVWGVESFTEAGYTIRLVVKTRPATQFGVMRELRIRLLDAFAEHGVLLPGSHWAIEHASSLTAGGRDTAAGDRPEGSDRERSDAEAVGFAFAAGALTDAGEVADNGMSPAVPARTGVRRPAQSPAEPAGEDSSSGEDGPSGDAPQPADPDTAAPHPRRGDPTSEA